MEKVIRKLPSEVWKYFGKQKDGKMKGKLCPWSRLANATRMTKHWDEKHTKKEGKQPNNVSQASTQAAPKKPKIEDHLHHSLDHIALKQEKNHGNTLCIFLNISFS